MLRRRFSGYLAKMDKSVCSGNRSQCRMPKFRAGWNRLCLRTQHCGNRHGRRAPALHTPSTDLLNTNKWDCFSPVQSDKKESTWRRWWRQEGVHYNFGR